MNALLGEGVKLSMYRYLLLGLIITMMSGCSVIGAYATPEEAIQYEFKDSKASNHFKARHIITVDKDFAFFLSSANSISVAHLKKTKQGWGVIGATGGRFLDEISISSSGISPALSLSNEQILYGFFNNTSITSAFYKSIEGHIVDLTKYLPNKQEHKDLKLWYIALPQGQKMSLEDANQVTFKTNSGETIPYKNE